MTTTAVTFFIALLLFLVLLEELEGFFVVPCGCEVHGAQDCTALVLWQRHSAPRSAQHRLCVLCPRCTRSSRTTTCLPTVATYQAACIAQVSRCCTHHVVRRCSWWCWRAGVDCGQLERAAYALWHALLA